MSRVKFAKKKKHQYAGCDSTFIRRKLPEFIYLHVKIRVTP